MQRSVRKTIAILAVVLIGVLAMAGVLAGCGEKDENLGAGTYTYAYKAINGNTYERGAYNFSKDITMQWRALDITLELKSDGTFSMDTNVYMVEDTPGSSLEVGEKFPFGDGMYQESFTSATGTWTSTQDTISIKADWAKYKLPDQGSSYFVFNPNGMGYNDMTVSDTYVGEWDSTAVPEVLTLVPDTTFFVDGKTIKGFVKSSYEHTVVSESAALYFYEDTVYVRDIANKEGASYSYSVANDELVLSSTSYVQGEDGQYQPVTTEYKAKAGENLVVGKVTIAISAEDIAALA